jgi:hypothetical protein
MIRCNAILIISRHLHTNRAKIYGSIHNFRNWFVRVSLLAGDEFWLRTNMIRCPAILLISYTCTRRGKKYKIISINYGTGSSVFPCILVTSSGSARPSLGQGHLASNSTPKREKAKIWGSIHNFRNWFIRVSLHACDEYWLCATLIRCSAIFLISHHLHTNRAKRYLGIHNFRNVFIRVSLHACDVFWLHATMIMAPPSCFSLTTCTRRGQNYEGLSIISGTGSSVFPSMIVTNVGCARPWLGARPFC